MQTSKLLPLIMSSSPAGPDNALMKLAHPIRCAVEPQQMFEKMHEFLGEQCWSNMVEAFREPALTAHIIGGLVANPENARLRHVLSMSSQMEGGTEVGNSYAALLYLRQTMHPQPYFVIDDDLVQLLENTDIADDIPVSMLNVPYDRFYMELGKKRISSLVIPNVQSGDHVLEGFYCEKGVHPTMGDGLFFLITGSPLGKTEPMDDATHSTFLSTKNPDATIREALADTFARGRAVSVKHGLRETPATYLTTAFDSMMYLTKVMLYLGLSEARRAVHNDKSEWTKKTRSLHSPAKKGKAERRGRALVDHILISAPPALPADPAVTAGMSGRSVKAHWRRGHYRMQAYGVQLSQRRLIFIRPALVHGEDQAPAQAPQYLVQ
jgi:hypothetical protein